MALPRTIVELFDRANLSGNERQLYEQKITSIFQRVRDKSYREGKDVGFAEGMDTCFDIVASEEETDNVQNIS